MNKIFWLLLLAMPLAFGNRALADGSDYDGGYSLDNSGDLPTDNVPRFVASHVQGTVLKVQTGSDGFYFYYTYEAVGTANNTVVLTNCYVEYQDTSDGPSYRYNGPEAPSFVGDFNYAGYGLYSATDPGSQDAQALAGWVNAYLTSGALPENVASITENHDGSSFSVSCDLTNWNGWATAHFQVSKSYDGAVLPTRNMNHGRDNDPCQPGCADCAGHGVPVWDVSQPYLNLWVHDTPVFYRTSLGQEVAFTINYKQRDTRPRDDGQYPTTGWNHNWYSYVRFDVPTFVIGNNTSQTNIAGLTPRGFQVRQGWQLTNDCSKWEAILYAPDNGESYFSAGSPSDPQNQRTLVPMYNYNSSAITGFRLVHGDGSQDIYSLAGTGQSTYGITERYGCEFDKGGLTNGMEGVWQLPISGADTPYRPWQAADDAASYGYGRLGISGSLVEQCDYYQDSQPPDPTVPIAYTGYDALLTARVDPYGNAITLGYTSNRLSTITDYDSRTNYLSYDTNGYLQSVAMPYGRTAYFNHDSAGNLQSITDAQGMNSSMTYIMADGGLNRRLASLTTPYGITRFEYEDDMPYVLVHFPSYYAYTSGQVGLVNDALTVRVYVGENNANHAIMVTQPDESQELYFYSGITNGSQVPTSLWMSTGVQQDWGGLVDNGGSGEASLQPRNCFHWGRVQTPLLSMVVSTNMALTNLTAHDFLMGTWQHFPVDASDSGSANWNISPFPTFIREGSPDGVGSGNTTWFSYNGQSSAWQLSGDPLNWSKITGAPDGSALVTSYSYNGWGLLTQIDEPYTKTDGSLSTRSYGFGYAQVSVGGTQVMVPQSFSWPGYGSVSLNTPQAATVNGYPVLSWPMVQATDSEGNTSQLFFNARHQLRACAKTKSV